jgi:hypothetical protein
VFKGGETYYVYFIYSKESTKQTYQIYVGENGFNEDTDVSFVQVTLLDPIQLPINTNTFPDGWVKDYDSTTGILTVTVDMKVFESEFTEVEEDFCQPASFCTLSANGCGCSDDLTGDLKTQCVDGNICGRWAGKDIDCPSGGCPGFSFKLPSGQDGFVADDKGNTLQPAGHRPDPVCFPQELPWTAPLTRPIPLSITGSCETTPIDNTKFCITPGVPAPDPPDEPETPPVGGGLDKDGDGVVDSIDEDSDNDGIPNNKETATNGIDPLTSSRIVIPADPDNDGIPNELDLDSDGDCIPDHFEAGGGINQDSNSDGREDNFTDIDGDGLHDGHDPDQGGTILPLPDTDGDDIPDFLDTDSDNDGMTDTDETGGSGDANNDGVLDDPTDANSDGLADSVPLDTGNICVILDTDGDGLPDHLDAVTQAPDGPPGDGNGDGDGGTNNGACALAGSEVISFDFMGLAMFALLPLAIVLRRKLRAKIEP